MALIRHVKFFVELASVPEREGGGWDGSEVLAHFGTPRLRAHELPVRWLTAELGLEITVHQKTASSDVRRLAQQLAELVPEHPARELLQAFHQALSRRVADGEISPKTARMSFRPAIDLMAVSSSPMPTQDDVADYLIKAPGQRAAIFAFTGFLRSSYGLNLAVPAPSARAIAYRRHRALELQVREMLLLWPRPADFDDKWLTLALMYFHWLSSKEASRVIADARVSNTSDGFELEHGMTKYWVPNPSRPFGL